MIKIVRDGPGRIGLEASILAASLPRAGLNSLHKNGNRPSTRGNTGGSMSEDTLRCAESGGRERHG
jgi:hypothetical protein